MAQTTTTITEALAELKMLTSRILKKREHSSHYILRDSRAVDPMLTTGGSPQFIAIEWQSIRDLEVRYIAIRRAIAEANLRTNLTLDTTTLCITDWLTWRRDIAPNRKAYLTNVLSSIQRARKEAVNLTQKMENSPPGFAAPSLLINLDEPALIADIESLDKILSDLDGKLSLLNATTTITI